jgi:hypothetical protein
MELTAEKEAAVERLFASMVAGQLDRGTARMITAALDIIKDAHLSDRIDVGLLAVRILCLLAERRLH